MAKFKARTFKNWLDILAKSIVKTRDDFTCQIGRPGCAGTMLPLDFNCQWCHIKSRQSNIYRWDLLNIITGCAHCHQWGHSNPNEFGVWFANKFPVRNGYLNNPIRPTLFVPENSTIWHENDFRRIELYLLNKCIDLEVNCLSVNTAYRSRFIKLLAVKASGNKA